MKQECVYPCKHTTLTQLIFQFAKCKKLSTRVSNEQGELILVLTENQHRFFKNVS